MTTHTFARAAAFAAALTLPPIGIGAAPSLSADRLFASGDFAGARAAYDDALRERPNDPDAARGAALLALYRGDATAAATLAETSLAGDPGDASARSILARARQASDDDAAAGRDAPSGEIDLPFERSGPLPKVVVDVDGRPAHFVVDTGGPGLDVSAAFAARVGFVAPERHEASFAGSRPAAVREGGTVSVTIGGTRLPDVAAGIAPVPGPDVDGVIGTGFLRRFLATIDYPHGRLVLRPRAASPTFEAAAATAGATIEPMYLVDRHLFATARVGSAPPGLFAIDTGGPMIGADLTAATVAAAHIDTSGATDLTLMGGGGPVHARGFTVPSVTLGATTVTSVPGIAVDGPDPYMHLPFRVAGRLSQEFFRRTAVTFDFVAMRIVVEAAFAKAGDGRTNRSAAAAAALALDRRYVNPERGHAAAGRCERARAALTTDSIARRSPRA